MEEEAEDDFGDKKVMPAEPNRRFRVTTHPQHHRLKRIWIESTALQEFFEHTSNETVKHLEYVPFSRFIVAKYLRDVLGVAFVETLKQILHDRSFGGLTISIATFLEQQQRSCCRPIDELCLLLSTALTHLIGIPNFDAMNGTYYARFVVQHTDNSDSYLRKPYTNMTLHTDGTYVNEPTDWVLMMKLQERNVGSSSSSSGGGGGRSRLLHLDDWSELDRFHKHSLANHPFLYQSPPSKNVSVQVYKPTVFFQTNNHSSSDNQNQKQQQQQQQQQPQQEKGQPCLCFIDQFVHPTTIEQAKYLHDLSASMEGSPGTKFVQLPVGELILLNNTFWVHGREAFAGPNQKLFRELLRQRGGFCDT